MADQEFLASFAVEIDETGVSRLQAVLEENRELAAAAAEAFSAAAASVREYAKEISESLPGLFSGRGNGITAEYAAGGGSLKPGLDLTQADSALKAFTERAAKPVPLSANASGITSAARAALDRVKSMFSDPLTIRVKSGNPPGGDSPGGTVKMSAGGRFSRPMDVQVAEDGNAEYIIPVKREDRAVPLLRQLLAELSPAARESLSGSAGSLCLSAGVTAGTASAGSVIQDNRTVSAPVSIDVHASGADPERIGRSIYDTAERYLLRAIRPVFP